MPPPVHLQHEKSSRGGGKRKVIYTTPETNDIYLIRRLRRQRPGQADGRTRSRVSIAGTSGNAPGEVLSRPTCPRRGATWQFLFFFLLLLFQPGKPTHPSTYQPRVAQAPGATTPSPPTGDPSAVSSKGKILGNLTPTSKHSQVRGLHLARPDRMYIVIDRARDIQPAPPRLPASQPARSIDLHSLTP